jgi:methionine-rich copper-binding protein CopC
LRKTELKNQISSIENCIEKTIVKESELSSLISIAKNDFLNFRNIEFTQQLESITQILSQIDTIFNNNTNNPDLTNTDKINGFGFKLLSVFSKSKKQTITDHIELQRNSIKLEECLKISKDFQTLNFSGNLEAKKNSLPTLKTEIAKVKTSFSDKIENEFTLFNLNSVLVINDSGNKFKSIQSAINDSNNSEAFITKLREIQATFKNYLYEINSEFKALSKVLAESKDIKLNETFDKTFKENKEAVSELKEKIELIKNEFDSKIQNEFQQISLLKAKPNEIEIKSLPILQEKVNALAEKIKSDSWTVQKVKFTEFYKFISDIETLIRNKNEYFKAEKDLFTIEFKWFQFYNALSESEKTIINELKPKNNWKKTFLIFYLNSLLVNSANLNLPTSDDEHKELEITLNGVENSLKSFGFQNRFIQQESLSKKT